VLVLVAIHLSAILVAVVGAGNPRFPAPILAARARFLFMKPYLEATFLTNPYRFFAPDPGPTTLLWARLHYQDGSVRWVEVPRREDFSSGVAYHRHLALVMLFDHLSVTSPDVVDPNRRESLPEGRIVLESYVRHLAHHYAGVKKDGATNPVKRIQFFTVWHRVLEPWQIQRGWEISDLRLYTPFYYGTFTAEGIQIDHGTTKIEPRLISEVAAMMLGSDAYPLFRQHPNTDRMELLEEIGAPAPIRALVLRFPELANPDLDLAKLHQRIQAFVESESIQDSSSQ
jgi:hypothetical protein